VHFSLYIFCKIYTPSKCERSEHFLADHWRRNAPPAGGCYILFFSAKQIRCMASLFTRLFIIFWNGQKTTEITEGHREKKQWLSVSSVVIFLCHNSFHPNILKSLLFTPSKCLSLSISFMCTNMNNINNNGIYYHRIVRISLR